MARHLRIKKGKIAGNQIKPNSYHLLLKLQSGVQVVESQIKNDVVDDWFMDLIDVVHMASGGDFSSFACLADMVKQPQYKEVYEKYLINQILMSYELYYYDIERKRYNAEIIKNEIV